MRLNCDIPKFRLLRRAKQWFIGCWSNAEPADVERSRNFRTIKDCQAQRRLPKELRDTVGRLPLSTFDQRGTRSFVLLERPDFGGFICRLGVALAAGHGVVERTVEPVASRSSETRSRCDAGQHRPRSRPLGSLPWSGRHRSAAPPRVKLSIAGGSVRYRVPAGKRVILRW